MNSRVFEKAKHLVRHATNMHVEHGTPTMGKKEHQIKVDIYGQVVEVAILTQTHL